MSQSTIALLGTLRELHTVLPEYDLPRLEELVAAKKPDLLCVEVDRVAWETDDLGGSPIESRDVLAGLARSSEITLVPIGGGGRSWSDSGVDLPRHGILATFRRRLSAWLDTMTVDLMKLAGRPEAVNSPLVEHLCGILCDLQVMLANGEARRAWTARNQELLDSVVWIVRRDPGRRILVALDCRRKHWLRSKLRSVPDVKLAEFWRF
ncbi:MAG: hypothetical protein HY675_14160 [Chloroflexi bacterium]|nr:hypothetical protein [Chloroflexota bacterium]